MNEEKIRKDIRKILIESLDEVHLTLGGKYVPFESEECYRDLTNRIADAEAQRNCCDRGTAARMHYNGLLSILRQKSKKHPLYFKNINQKISLKEANLYSTFIQPFTDILASGKLVFQSTLSSFWLNFRALLAINPKTIDKLINDHENRMKKFEKEFEPVLKRNEIALSNPDAQIAFMFLAPSIWAEKFAVDWSKDKIGSFIDFIKKDISNDSSSNKSNEKNKNDGIGKTNSLSNFEKKFNEFKKLFQESKNFNSNASFLMEKKDALDNEFLNALKDFTESDSRKEAAKSFKDSIELTIKPFNENLEIIEKMMIIVNQADSIEKMFKEIKDLKIDNEQKIFEIEKLKNEFLKMIASSQKEIKNISNPNNPVGSKLNQALKGILVAKNSQNDEDIENLEVDEQKIKNMKLNQEKVKQNSEKLILNSLKSDLNSKGKQAVDEKKNEIGNILIDIFPFIKNDDFQSAIQQIDSDFSNFLNKIKSDYKI